MRMFENMSDGLKLFLLLMAYTVSMVWWASKITATVEFNQTAIRGMQVILKEQTDIRRDEVRGYLELSLNVKDLNKRLEEQYELIKDCQSMHKTLQKEIESHDRGTK